MAPPDVMMLAKKMDQVLEIIRGNELDPNDSGILGKVNDFDKRLTKIEKLINKGAWILFGMAFSSGWGLAKILIAISEAIHK